jgi:hypothetical protein
VLPAGAHDGRDFEAELFPLAGDGLHVFVLPLPELEGRVAQALDPLHPLKERHLGHDHVYADAEADDARPRALALDQGEGRRGGEERAPGGLLQKGSAIEHKHFIEPRA